MLYCYCGGTKLKRVLAVVLAFLMLSGCDMLTFSVDSLLTAPSVADEQAAIHQALIESVGKSITLCYPRSGDYRSAFVVTDIDSDGGDEALAFYTYSQSIAAKVMISVLDKDDDGWHAVYELEGRGLAIDKVMISDYGRSSDIVIGYETQGFEENNVSIYRFTRGIFASLFDGSYTILERLDMDGCGTPEITIVKKTGTAVIASIIKTANGLDYSIEERVISVNASQITSSCFGLLYDNVSALFVDIADINNIVTTQVIYLGENEILSPTLEFPEISELTARQMGYASADYDGDGVVEIPIATPFLGYSQAGSAAEYMTSWLTYDSDLNFFTAESATYYNTAVGYVFKLPNRWLNLVTVVRDDASRVVSFIAYDTEFENISDMPKLVSIAAVSPDNEQAYINDGYSYLSGDGFISFMTKNLAPDGEPLLLTQDEMKNNIYCLY